MAKSNNQLINTEITGLQINDNPFSRVPRGSLEIANNITLRKKSLATPRRGFADISNRASTGLFETTLVGLGTGAADRMTGSFQYQGEFLLQMQDGGLFFFDVNTQTWKSVATPSTPQNPDVTNGYFVDVIRASRNLYFTSAEGVLKIDTIGENIAKLSGMPRGLGGSTALVGTSGFLADDTAIAYRVVWGTTDLNENLILGAPSQRIIAVNASTPPTVPVSTDVDITFTVPKDITTLDFYQLYRSFPSANAESEPDDNMQLIFESNPTAGEITVREVVVSDVLPDSLRGAALYTNSAQEGILQANDRPPAALVVETFNGHSFYGAPTPKAILSAQIISIGGVDGLQIGDTIEIFIDVPAVPTAVIFTGAAVEDAAANEFAIITSNISIGQNVEDTTTSLVRVVNKHFSNLGVNITMFYNQDPGEFPGQFVVEGGVGTFEFRRFAFGTSRPSSFLDGSAYNAVVGPVVLQTAYGKLSLPDFDSNMSVPYKNAIDTVQANTIFISKFNQPEAVPFGNFITVGTASDPILAIVASRDKLFIFKRDEGIFRLSGDILKNFRVDQHDNTVRIVGPRSARRIANQIYLNSDQGVVAVSDAGTSVVSRPIEDTLVEIMGRSENATVLSQIFASGYESEREYILSVPDGIPDSNEPVMVKQFVYNIFTNAWTVWDIAQDSSSVIDNKAVYGGKNIFGSNTLFIERKTYTINDVADEEADVTILSIDPDGVTLTMDETSGFRIGWKLEQRQASGLNIRANVLSIDGATIVIEPPKAGSFETGQTFIFEPYLVTVQWIPEDCDNVGMQKRFNEYTFIFQGANFPEGTLQLKSSDTTGFAKAPLIPIFSELSEGWGGFKWGQQPWGGVVSAEFQQNIRVLSPREPRIGQWVIIRVDFDEALTNFEFAGYSLSYKELSTRRR